MGICIYIYIYWYPYIGDTLVYRAPLYVGVASYVGGTPIYGGWGIPLYGTFYIGVHIYGAPYTGDRYIEGLLLSYTQEPQYRGHVI